MKLSTTATYGLRTCFLLALDNKTVSLTTLVKRTDLSEKYLERILGKLRKSGIVGTKRGISGGYYLNAPPAAITVNAIFKALGCEFDVANCAKGECNDSYCPNRVLLKRIHAAANEILDNTTLEDMINDYKCK